MEFFLSVAVSNSQFSIQTLCHIWLQLSAQKNSLQDDSILPLLYSFVDKGGFG